MTGVGRLTEVEYVRAERMAIQLDSGVVDTEVMFPAVPPAVVTHTAPGCRDTEHPPAPLVEQSGIAQGGTCPAAKDENRGTQREAKSGRKLVSRQASRAGFSQGDLVLRAFALGVTGPWSAVTLNAPGASPAKLRRAVAAFSRRCAARGPVWFAFEKKPGGVAHAHGLVGFELRGGEAIKIWRQVLRERVLARSSAVRHRHEYDGALLGWLRYSTKAYEPEQLAEVHVTGPWSDVWDGALALAGISPQLACRWCLSQLHGKKELWCSRRCKGKGRRGRHGAISGAMAGPSTVAAAEPKSIRPDQQSDEPISTSAPTNLRYVEASAALLSDGGANACGGKNEPGVVQEGKIQRKMSKEAGGELRSGPDGFSARITLKGKKRHTFPLPHCTDEASALERCNLLARIAKRFRRVGRIDDPAAQKLLEMLAMATPLAQADVLSVCEKFADGKLVEAGAREVPTFRAFAEEWTSGALHKRYPDYVKRKDSGLDAQRVRRLAALDLGGMPLGDVPLDRFTLDHAQTAMANLPTTARRPATRRAYAQVIHRVLALAVYPCRVIEHHPLPKGFLPKAGKRKAFTFLRPVEETKLLVAATVPIEYRLLYGFLSREGCRAGEALALRFRDLDLATGTITLMRTKTEESRTWPLDPSVADALALLRNKRETERLAAGRVDPVDGELVFRDEAGEPFVEWRLAKQLRQHLTAAGVTRSELFESTEHRSRLRLHDLRGTFVTLSLAAGRSETWVMDRTGHTSSQMVNRYRRPMRTAAELDLGQLLPMAHAIPELADYPALAPNASSLGSDKTGSGPPIQHQGAAFQAVGHCRLELQANGLREGCAKGLVRRRASTRRNRSEVDECQRHHAAPTDLKSAPVPRCTKGPSERWPLPFSTALACDVLA